MPDMQDQPNQGQSQLPQSISGDVNWGQLQPLQGMSPVKASTPMAPPPPSLQGPGSDLPNGLGMNPGMLSSMGNLGSALSNFVGQDSTKAVSQLHQNSQGLLSKLMSQNNPTPQQSANPNQPQPTAMPGTQPVPVNPMAPVSLGSPTPDLKAIRDAAAAEFPNSPVMQQMAVAQASQESGLLGGKPSKLASQYNNFYGIKGKGTAGTVELPTHEYVNGHMVTTTQPFAVYKSPEDSVKAYKELMNSPNYKGVLSAKDFQSATKAVQNAGYATDPNYSRQLEAVNQQLSHIKDVNDAFRNPTPNLQGGVPVPPWLEQSPAFHQAITNYAQLRQQGVTKSPYVVSVDYSLPATAKRLSVINAETGKVVFQSEVAQGKGGFSNEPGSNASSLGTFQTTAIYDGKHGESLRIKGLNPGLNDNVEKRNVVVHGADYIGNGKTGHSFGCFAVPQANAAKLINLIKDGAIIQASAGSQSF